MLQAHGVCMNDAIIAALPGSITDVAARIGQDVANVRHAMHKLAERGLIEREPGRSQQAQNVEYRVTVHRPVTARMAIRREWVPPRTIRRAEFDAPGFVIREHLTGRNLG